VVNSEKASPLIAFLLKAVFRSGRRGWRARRDSFLRVGSG
jgi:hypothetical protein